MPRYFFHVRQKGTLFEDRQGAVFADLAAASAWAVQDARAIRRSGALIGPVSDHSIEIGDAKGATLASLPFADMPFD